jgi:hypothetical protein
MVAAKNGALELQPDRSLHRDEELLLAQWLLARKPARKRCSPCGKLTTSVAQKSCVALVRRADCRMLRRQRLGRPSVEAHSPSAGSPPRQDCSSRLRGRVEGFPLCERCQHGHRRRFGPTSQGQTRAAVRRVSLGFSLAGCAAAVDEMGAPPAVDTDGFENGDQTRVGRTSASPSARKTRRCGRHSEASQPMLSNTSSSLPPELLCGAVYHLAESALVPRAAIGHGQNQRFRLAGRAEKPLT